MSCDTNDFHKQKIEKSSQSAKWRSVCTRVNPESIFRGRLWHKTHPNPRRPVCPSGVDRAWEIQSEHKRQIVVSPSPFVPPILLLHHHLLLPPIQEHRIFANFPLVQIHGPHQGKITTSFSRGSLPLTDFLAILPANRSQVHRRWVKHRNL